MQEGADGGLYDAVCSGASGVSVGCAEVLGYGEGGRGASFCSIASACWGDCGDVKTSLCRGAFENTDDAQVEIVVGMRGTLLELVLVDVKLQTIKGK